METILNQLNESWADVKDLVLYGYGRHGERILEALECDFNIVAIIDNNPSKENISHTPQILYSKNPQAYDYLKHYKILVTTQEYYYVQIAEQLKEIGLRENIDFIHYQNFLPEWYFKYKKKIYLVKTDVAIITSRCSLKCKKCQLFMPYWNNKQDRSLKEIKNDLDLYFKNVDFVFDMAILGGEPLLYQHLSELLRYIGDTYLKNKIGRAGIITNGTSIPDDEILDVIKKYGFVVTISNYHLNDQYNYRLQKLEEVLSNHKIYYHIDDHIDWFDFGYPDTEYHYTGEAAKRHMMCCNTVCHSLYDKKFWYCGIAMAAEKSGLFEPDEHAYVDLTSINPDNIDERKQILLHSLGYIYSDGGYLKHCQNCGGFGVDNNNIIPTAEQLL